jgi:hypothetical protein
MLQEIEKDNPDLLKFGDEFQGVTELASKSKKLRTSFLYKNNNLGFFFVPQLILMNYNEY